MSPPPKSASCKPRRGAQNTTFTQFGLSSSPTPAPAGGRLSAAPVGAAPCSRGAPRCGGAVLRVAFRRGRLAAPVVGHARQKVSAQLVAAHPQVRKAGKYGETLPCFTRCALCSFWCVVKGHDKRLAPPLTRRGCIRLAASLRCGAGVTTPRPPQGGCGALRYASGSPVSLRHIVNYRHGVGGLGVFPQSPQQLFKAFVFLCCAQH